MATQVATSVPSKRLATSILSTDLTLQINNILRWDGAALTSADFGTRAFGVFRNSTNTQYELFEFDPTTIANSSITIISRGLSYSGATTANAVTAYNWNSNETIVELGSHTPQLFEQYMDKTSNETVAGVKTFSSSPVVPTGGSGTQAANNLDISNAITGASGTATNLVNGTTKLSVAAVSGPAPIAVGDNDPRVPTQGENDGLAATTTPASSNLFLTQKDFQKGVETYAADSVGTDSYAITLSPAIAAYANGMVFRFKAGTANTGAATLAINGLAAKAIVKNFNTALATGDILAGQIVEVQYESVGDNFQMLSPVSAAVSAIYKSGVFARAGDTASGSQTIAHGLGTTPKYIRISVRQSLGTNQASISNGVYNGTTTSCVFVSIEPSGTSNYDTTNIIRLESSGGAGQVATATFDSTNINLNWTYTSTVNSANMHVMWEAFA